MKKVRVDPHDPPGPEAKHTDPEDLLCGCLEPGGCGGRTGKRTFGNRWAPGGSCRDFVGKLAGKTKVPTTYRGPTLSGCGGLCQAALQPLLRSPPVTCRAFCWLLSRNLSSGVSSALGRENLGWLCQTMQLFFIPNSQTSF